MKTNRSFLSIGIYGVLALVLSSVTIGFAQAKNYQSKFVKANGVNIHYLKAGTGKRVLVVLHGFGEDSRMWIPLFADFGKEFIIIAPDLRGLGESSAAPAYDKKSAAVDIHELVKSLGYQKIDLVGHDIGLMVAYAYAAQFPAEVEKLALLEAPIPGVGEVWEQIYSNPALWHFHFVKSSMALDLVKGRERIFLEHFLGEMAADPKTVTEAEKQMYAASYARPGVMKAAFEMFKAFNAQDAEDNRKFAATKLPMPLLVITGDKSMGDALAAQAKLVSDNVTAVKFADTGHWLMSERQAETKAELKKFFALK